MKKIDSKRIAIPAITAKAAEISNLIISNIADIFLLIDYLMVGLS